MQETDRLGRAKSQSRLNQGLKTAMLGFCMAQRANISSCTGIRPNGCNLNIQYHGILKKSVVNWSNRTCLFNNAGSDFAVTIVSTDLCAMSRVLSNQESSFAASGEHLINDYIDGLDQYVSMTMQGACL